MVSSLGKMIKINHLLLPDCRLYEDECSILCRQLRTVPLLEVLDLNMASIGEPVEGT